MCSRKKKGVITLFPFHRAPKYLQSNPYITNGYRVNLTTKQCFLSIFSWNNETLNIWSHLGGLVVFIGLFLYDLMVVYHNYLGTFTDAVIASFVLCSFMLCMIFSSLYHTLNSMSEDACKQWLSWDIFGIAASFLAIFLSGIYYGFWCEKHLLLRYMYSGFVVMLFASTLVFVIIPKFMSNEWDFVRLLLFFFWSISGFLPIIHWTILHGYTNKVVQIFLPRLIKMYLISGVALVIYVFKIPEIFWPGKFNIIGSSHQWWHVIIVLALIYWHQIGIEYARYRFLFGCSSVDSPAS